MKNRILIEQLQQQYYAYMSTLKTVVELGDSIVDDLLDSLSHKHANPIAKALGLILHTSPLKRRDIMIRLARTLVGMHPIYPESLEALVRAGEFAWPIMKDEISMYCDNSDDEGVRCMLDVATRLPDSIHPELANILKKLLASSNQHIREAACDAVSRLGLPSCGNLYHHLITISKLDYSDTVRTASLEALKRIGNDISP